MPGDVVAMSLFVYKRSGIQDLYDTVRFMMKSVKDI